MVHVGFLSACDTNGPPSVTNRFLQSCAWHQRFSTDVPGSLPMRVPPSSWMMVPPVASPYPCSAVGIGENTSPPISAISARKVSCMCFDCLYSWSDHFQWNRSTGDRKSTRLNSSHGYISYAVFCLKKKKKKQK